MLIGIDASRALRAHRTGTERYSLELINALLDLNSGDRFRLYVPTPPPPKLFRPGAEIVVLPGRHLWTHTKLGPHTRAHPPDVLFVPAHVLPVIGPDNTVVTVHDLGYEHFPQAHPWRQRQYLRWSTRRHVRVSKQVIADSHATKADLIAFYGADPDRIHVVHLAPDPALKPESDPARIAHVRASYGIPPGIDYILHIGTIHPRKNLERLVEAFALLRQRLPARKLHLVLAGGIALGGDALRRKVQAMGLADQVRFPGYVRVHDIPALYTGAACYALPSLNEGFGFPALEAQVCGVPLVCAHTSSLPEVAGEGACYFDPFDVVGMADAIDRVLTEPELRSELIKRGRMNAQRFSWEKTARATLRVLALATSNKG
ncbi:MAG TPA: glycosyltransferase family 4 protein [Caldilineae bacterium]|nr:glycosyltransferase family 4 protein [Caldilineae bacterium]